MKFGQHFEEQQVQRWKEQYLQYDALKRRLYELSRPTMTRTISADGSMLSNPSEDVGERWRALLKQQAHQIGSFVDSVLEPLEVHSKELLNTRLQVVSPSTGTSEDTGGAAASSAHVPADQASPAGGQKESKGKLLVWLLKSVGAVKNEAAELRRFVELNHAAFYKILKKSDKMLGRSDGVSKLLPELISDAKLNETSRWDSLEASLSEAVQDQRMPTSVLQLAHGLACHGVGVETPSRPTVERGERTLFFFLGSAVSLLLSIFVLILVPIPDKDKDTFLTAYFLAPFPVFRVGVSAVLVLWSMGAVARTCEKNHISHFFVLDVDPRCRIGPRILFASAAFLTSAWILIFGMYVVDYKWEVLPPMGAQRGINARSSVHFLFYPLLLIAAFLIVFLRPSSTCTYRYRAGLVRGVVRTLLAPAFEVTFGDNLTGDVMTSLAKPLQDVPAALCYLFSHHPQTKHEVDKFLDHEDTCSAWEHKYVGPCIAGLPFLNRSLQCLRRYYDTREQKHLLNFGKYVASLLVVVVSNALPHDSGSVILVSAFATIYAFAWDVTMDWGFGRDDFLPIFCPKRAREFRGSLHKRSLSPCTYTSCVALDLIARLAWVNTLLPISIITHDVVLREVLKTFLTVVEIARRAMWSVLRIEWEQVSNAGGFPALLWVPGSSRPVEMSAL